jgi:PAS domain S-box-containing protein
MGAHFARWLVRFNAIRSGVGGRGIRHQCRRSRVRSRAGVQPRHEEPTPVTGRAQPSRRIGSGIADVRAMRRASKQQIRSFGPSRNEIAQLLELGQEAIIGDWTNRVRADSRVPLSEVLGEPTLVDHVPQILAAIVARLRVVTTTVPSIERDVGRGAASRAHAFERFHARYDVAAVMREFAHLRAAVLAHLRAHAAQLDMDTEQLLHAALDEAMSTAAVEVARQHHELLQAVISQSADGIVAVDERGRVRLVNDEAARQLGTTTDEASGQAASRTTGLLDMKGAGLPMERAPLVRALRGERVINEHWQVRRPDGSVRVLSGSATPLFHADGSPAGAVLIAHDDTERIRHERGRDLLARFSLALAQSLTAEATVQSLLGLVVPDFADFAMIDTLGPNGRFRREGFASADPTLDFLHAAEAHVPSSSPESPAAHVLATRTPLVRTDVTPAFLDALAANDREYRRMLDRIAPVSFLILPLTVRGRDIGVLKLISSRPERKYEPRDLDVAMGLADRAALAIDNARAYQDAADRAERLRHEAEWRERFMAMLSHDLRTPLSAVSLSAESMLRDPNLTERSATGAKRILRTTQRISRMITDLLDVARARTGGIAVHPRETDLCRVVEQVVEEVAKAWPGRKIDSVPGSPCTGVWDPDRIAQVVDNLVTNAIRYSPTDSVVRVQTGEYDGAKVFMRVTNAGDPIPPEVASVMYEPFKRGANVPKREGSGLGLGLYIASEIAKAHGGQLVLESSDERGTSFLMTLPRVARASTPPESTPQS